MRSSIQPPRFEPFEQLRQEGRRAAERGHLDLAVELFDRALSWAEEEGHEDLADRAFCGRSAAAIELGGSDEAIPRLRTILMRNRDEESCFLAAYNLARAYELAKEYRKALFYARLAKDRAELLQRPEWLASSHNQMGNLLLALSYFEEACAEYRSALEHLPPVPSIRQALIFDNLGYCAVVKGRYREGFRLLFQSLRYLQKVAAERFTGFPHLALCFAYMEVGRLRRAQFHGRAALTIAEAAGDRQSIKNSLFLLGQAAHLSGDPLTAQRAFARLQTEFYPEAGFSPELLLAVDARRLVNLRA
jgi:tetratricopeptide (TPR) repeat protein